MTAITKDKAFYKSFFTMMGVLALQNILTISVNLADNIMLGNFSEAALSGAAAVNQLQFVYQQIIAGIGEGVVILASQYWGRKNTGKVKDISSIGMRLMLGIALLLFLAVSLAPGSIMKLFTYDLEINYQGVLYFGIIRFTYLMFGITIILLATLRSIGKVKIALLLSVSTLIINCSLNYVLIYGHFGFPRLGIQGAAIGTLTARTAEILWLLFYLRKEKELRLRIQDYFHVDLSLFKQFLKVCLPVVAVQGLWGVATALQTVALGHMTSSAIAANSIAANVYLIFKSAAIGAASATAVIIGRTIGEGKSEKLKEYASSLQVIFLGVGILTGIFLFLIRIPILNFYDVSEETRTMANAFLLILSVTGIGTAYQMPVNNGIIRGGGDTKFTMYQDLISIWCIVQPLAFFMAFVVKASPVVVMMCFNADQIFKCVPAFIKCNFGNWAKKLTK